MLPLIQQMQVDLRSGTLTPTVFAEDLEHVQKSLQVCRRIFGGMLTFSRNAARRSRDGHVRRAIETASAILRYGMSRSAIELHVDVPDDVPAVACSQSDLEQVFLNLLTNAREATPHGGRIVVTVRSADRVVNIASPIPGGILGNIFRGCSSRSSRSRTATASGCRSAARSCGKSTARSRFRASPATARTSMRCRPAGGIAAARTGVMRQARILVVDDEPGMLRAVDRVLSKDHHVVEPVSRARRCRWPASSIPELAIVDIRMPDLDGFELMAR